MQDKYCKLVCVLSIIVLLIIYIGDTLFGHYARKHEIEQEKKSS